jgi:UDP-GlcNAc:undecaprenyl-phosphate GlcNAc-1-phosphate transferase
MTIAFRLVLLGAATTLLSAFLTWVLVHASVRLRLVAPPREDRWHTAPTPNTGGIAIVLSAIAAFAFWSPAPYGSIVAGGAAIALLGFIDDRVQLRPSSKLLGQALLAAAVIAGGVVFPATHYAPVDRVLTWFWIVGITNAFNLIDNMDGLCAGVAVIIAASRIWSAWQSGDPAGAVVAVVLVGAYLGFLVFNRHPARIFMGDCGSMFAGFTLACLAAASPIPNTKAFLSSILSPLLTFLYPVFDTVLVSVLRRAAGKPISVGGRDHSSHRLVSLGRSESAVVAILWMMTAAGAAVGLSTAWMPIGVHALATFLLAGVLVFGTFLGTLPTYPFPERSPVRGAAIRRWIPTLRAAIVLLLDVLLAGVALLTAFLVRWEDTFPGKPTFDFLVSLPIVLVCYAAAALLLRTSRAGWRWFGIADLLALLQCALVGSALAAVIILPLIHGYSRAVILVFCIMVFMLTAAMRAAIHLFRQTLVIPSSGRRAAILASDPWTEVLVLALQNRNRNGLGPCPACVIDTDRTSHRSRVRGIRVHYAGADPVSVLKHCHVDLLIVSGPGANSPSEQGVLDACVSAGIAVQRFDFSMTPWGPPAAAMPDSPAPQNEKGAPWQAPLPTASVDRGLWLH